MKPQLSDILLHVAEETLENLAFMFSFPGEEENGEDGGTTLVLGVNFSGSFTGRMTMKISSGALPEIAANMLGLEEDETTEADQRDAAAEALNVICGNLLPRIAGKQAIFNITSPEVVREGTPEKAGSTGELHARANLSLEGGACELSLQIDGDPSLIELGAEPPEEPE